MFAPRTVIAVIVGLLLSHSGLWAQSRIEVILSGVSGTGCNPRPEGPPVGVCNRAPGTLVEIDVDSARIVSQTTLPEQPASPRVIVTADGRYVLWSSRDERTARAESAVALSYRDRLTGLIATAYRRPEVMFYDQGSLDLVGHPTQLVAYADANPMASTGLEVSANGVRETSAVPSSIAANGSVAVVKRQIVDLATGGTRCALPPPSPNGLAISSFVLSRDGSTVYGATSTFGGSKTVLSRFDASDCALQLEREAAVALGSRLWLDPVTGRLFIAGIGTAVFDPDTLTMIGAVSGPSGGASSLIRMVFDGHRPRAYRLFVESISGLGPFNNLVDVIDTAQMTVVAAGALRSGHRATDIAVVPLPSVPSDARSTVVGNQVNIEWRAGSGPGLANGYRVEAGSGPGLADLATFAVDAAKFTATDVPAGTYYVRVRALNAAGAGAASPEMMVTVP